MNPFPYSIRIVGRTNLWLGEMLWSLFYGSYSLPYFSLAFTGALNIGSIHTASWPLPWSKERHWWWTTRGMFIEIFCLLTKESFFKGKSIWAQLTEPSTSSGFTFGPGIIKNLWDWRKVILNTCNRLFISSILMPKSHGEVLFRSLCKNHDGELKKEADSFVQRTFSESTSLHF